jgi:DNA-binding NarL/FixJ family response regulator
MVSLRAVLSPRATILVFCNNLSHEEIQHFLRSGANGCILWQDLTTTVVSRMFALLLHSHLTVLSRSLMESAFPESSAEHASENLRANFTPRELAILRYLGQGLAHQEIAQREFLSVRSVRRTIHQLQRKLNAHSMFALGVRAGELGLADEPQREGSSLW